MSLSRKIIGWIGVTVLSISVLSAQEAIRNELEARKTEIDQKIANLFGHRDDPILPLPSSHNPFFRTDENVNTEDTGPYVPPTREDAELLAAIADTLAINGIVTFNNRDLVVINQSPTPEGRIVPVEFEGSTHFLRVEEIHSNRVVISMGDNAFMAIPIDRSDREDEPDAPPAAPDGGRPGIPQGPG